MSTEASAVGGHDFARREQISPELVLVDPELRRALLARSTDDLLDLLIDTYLAETRSHTAAAPLAEHAARGDLEVRAARSPRRLVALSGAAVGLAVLLGSVAASSGSLHPGSPRAAPVEPARQSAHVATPTPSSAPSGLIPPSTPKTAGQGPPPTAATKRLPGLSGGVAGSTALPLLTGTAKDSGGEPQKRKSVSATTARPKGSAGGAGKQGPVAPATALTRVSPRPQPPQKPAISPAKSGGGKASQARPATQRFAWAPVAGASAYEIAFFRQGVRIYHTRTRVASVAVPTGRRGASPSAVLSPGTYQWYVWPVRGGRRDPVAVVRSKLVVESDQGRSKAQGS